MALLSLASSTAVSMTSRPAVSPRNRRRGWSTPARLLPVVFIAALTSCGLPTPPLEVIDQAAIAGRTDDACERLFVLVNTDAQDDPFGNTLFQRRVKATMEAFERRGVDPVARYLHEQLFEADPMERWKAMDDLVRFCEDWLGEAALTEEA